MTSSPLDETLRHLADQLESTATWIEGHPNLPDEPKEDLLVKTWHVTKLRQAAYALRDPDVLALLPPAQEPTTL